MVAANIEFSFQVPDGNFPVIICTLILVSSERLFYSSHLLTLELHPFINF